LAVLFIWFTIQCWCNGWSNSQWENCWFHWAKRGEGFLGSHGDMNIICRLWTNLWFCYRWWQAIAYNWFSYFHYTYYKPLALVSMLYTGTNSGNSPKYCTVACHCFYKGKLCYSRWMFMWKLFRFRHDERQILHRVFNLQIWSL